MSWPRPRKRRESSAAGCGRRSVAHSWRWSEAKKSWVCRGQGAKAMPKQGAIWARRVGPVPPDLVLERTVRLASRAKQRRRNEPLAPSGTPERHSARRRSGAPYDSSCSARLPRSSLQDGQDCPDFFSSRGAQVVARLMDPGPVLLPDVGQLGLQVCEPPTLPRPGLAGAGFRQFSELIRGGGPLPYTWRCRGCSPS
jgi:hypothetical protein